MKNKKLATEWAIAIFEIYKEKNLINKLEKEVTDLFLLLNKNEEFINLINSSILNLEQRKKIINEVFSKSLSKDLFNAINLIVEKNISLILLDILKETMNKIDELNNTKHGIVFSVINLDQNQMNKLESKISKILNVKVKLINRINKSILGGIRISVNNIIIDYSILNQLNELKESINITL